MFKMIINKKWYIYYNVYSKKVIEVLYAAKDSSLAGSYQMTKFTSSCRKKII